MVFPNPVRTLKIDMTTHNELSLVDEEDFEDWLGISAIIRKLNNHFEDACNQLTRGFARVFGRSIVLTYNPISPAVLCDSFREVVLPFELSNKINSTLYHGFEKQLINGLVPLYEQATLLLSKYERAETKAADPPDQPHKAADRPKPATILAAELHQIATICLKSISPYRHLSLSNRKTCSHHANHREVAGVIE